MGKKHCLTATPCPKREGVSSPLNIPLFSHAKKKQIAGNNIKKTGSLKEELNKRGEKNTIMFKP